jgi:tetratricopeptide (TPR) repeat protein
MIDKLLNQGLSYHQQNKLNDAKIIYEQVLKLEPKNFSALQLLATVYAQKSDYQLAVNLFLKAIRINPNYGPCYGNLGNCLKQLGRTKEALNAFNKALDHDPNNAIIYSNRGVVLHDLGRLEEALLSYEKSIDLKINSAETFFNYGVVLEELGRFNEAFTSYSHALKIDSYHTSAISNRGNVLYKLGRFNEAVDDYKRLIILDSASSEIYYNCGNSLKELGRFLEALECYENAILENPIWAEAHCNKGNTLQELNRFDEALICFNTSIQFKPDYAEAYSNRGNVLQELGYLSEAINDYDKALQLSPSFIDAYSNLGLCLAKLKNTSDSLKCFEKAIQISSDSSADIRFNKAHVLLLSGFYHEGFREYEWRWKNQYLSASKNIRYFSQPLWLGKSALKNKTIFIYSEQGLGDTIQFSRYLPFFENLGARVIFEVQPPVFSLFKDQISSYHIIERGQIIPEFDYQAPLLSLPLAFETSLDSIPNQIPYLFANKTKINYWQNKLINNHGLKIGLVWNGGFRPDQPKLWNLNNRRNISIDLISHAFRDLDLNFFSLQKGEPAESEIQAREKELWPNNNFLNFSNELYDFSDTAALIANLDLIISVDTSVAHLAGAMGKPVWLLNRFDTCWRWLLDRNDSPWYPSIKIYRQSKFNDWQDVLDKVRIDLKNFNLISNRPN